MIFFVVKFVVFVEPIFVLSCLSEGFAKAFAQALVMATVDVYCLCCFFCSKLTKKN